MFTKSDYSFIKSGIDKREGFSLQKETEYPTLRIQPTVYAYKQSDKGKYTVGVTIYQSKLYGGCINIKGIELDNVFGTYENVCKFLKRNGYLENDGPVQQITIFDILD